MKSSFLKTSLYTTATATLLLCSSQNYAQQYYKWVDAHGSTHYTTTPPPKGAKRLDKVATYGSHSTAPTQTAAPNQTPNTTTTPREAPAATHEHGKATEQAAPATAAH